MCVSRSGYYKWFKTTGGKRQQKNEASLKQIREVFNRSRGTYGRRRISAKLKYSGITMSARRVGKLMKQDGLKAAGAKRYRVTTNSKHKRPVAGNLLQDKPAILKQDSVWTSDITYIPTSEGWLYLCVVLDAFSRRIVGWSMQTSLHADIVTRALEGAYQARKPLPGLIFHSDRGSQYASDAVRKKLMGRDSRQSMSGKGNCYDNAITETFFSSLKKELVYRCRFKTREEAKQAIFEYIEVFYNRERIHSSLGFKSPEEFERMVV